ncbi:hypothetical protein FPQ18DRAFT_413995, partial [Pyronema domesticum]
MEIKVVTIDSHFHGITPLYSGTDPLIDIIAVTGLGSHAFGTWKSRYGYKMWLRDFLPKDKALQNTRILLFGYRLDLKDNSSRDSIKEYARRLLIQLQHYIYSLTVVQERHRPIIFISHCFGGLLVKKPDQAIFKCCAALLFFGVPNQGMNNGDQLKLVGEQKNSQLVRDLGESSPLLRDIHENFAR